MLSVFVCMREAVNSHFWGLFQRVMGVPGRFRGGEVARGESLCQYSRHSFTASIEIELSSRSLYLLRRGLGTESWCVPRCFPSSIIGIFERSVKTMQHPHILNIVKIC